MEPAAIGSAVRVLYRGASPRRRRQLVQTLLVMLAGAVAELVTIGAVLPFLAVVLEPERAAQSELLAAVIGTFGEWGRSNPALALAALLIIATICASAIRLLLTWMTLKFVLLFGHDLGIQIFARMLRQPYRHFIAQNTSDYLAGIEKLQAVVYAVLLPVMQGLISAVLACLIIGFLFYIEPLGATFASVFLLSTYGLVSAATRTRLRKNSTVWAEAAGKRVRAIQEGLGGLRDILIDQSQGVFEDTFKEFDLRYRRSQAVNNFIALAPRYVVESAGIVLITLVAVYMITTPGGLIGAIPVLGALAIGAQRLLPLLQQAYNGWTSYQANRQMLLDVSSLLQMPVVPMLQRDKSSPPVAFQRNLVFDSVSFSYTGKESALSDVSFSISKGERIGIVGKTGSGKSTLMDLMMGLLSPTGGQIRVDDRPLVGEVLTNWQRQIAHVPQAIYLSDASIAANIAFGESEDCIDMERVRRVAGQAELGAFVSTLPDGYDTVVGERGVRLSGGQRQRIGIARALYKGATFLIFDEATSALDGETEAAVMDGVSRINRDVTLVLIAHRVSTLAYCERFFRLAEGRVEQVSSYAQLSRVRT